MKLIWRLIPFTVFALLVVFLWRGLSLDPHHLPLAQLNKPLPNFQLVTLGDSSVPFTNQLMHGQISLLNIWASWCEACNEEQIFLMQLARNGVTIYGLNYKDETHKAAQWLSEWGNPYKMVGEDREGKVAMDLGIYGAPETILVDKMGIIRYRHVGILDAQSWQQEFLPRIKALELKT